MRNREGHFGAVSQERVDALASINEGGTAEDFKSFLKEKGLVWEAFEEILY